MYQNHSNRHIRWARLLPGRIAIGILLLLAGAAGSAVGATALPNAPLPLSSPVQFWGSGAHPQRKAVETGEQPLDFRVAALDALRQASGPIELRGFPVSPGTTADLDLVPFEVLVPGAQVVVHGAGGETVQGFEKIAHFRGSIRGDPQSRVYLAAHPGMLVAILQTSSGVVYVGPEGSSGPVQHVLRTAASALNAEMAARGWECFQEELPAAIRDRERVDVPASDAPHPAGARSIQALVPKAAAATASLKQALISVETDQELLARFGGNVSSLTSFVTTLFGAIDVIYERDVLTRLAVNTVSVWTSTDPWSSSDARTQLDEVGDYWHANHPLGSNPRALVHFLSGKNTGGGKGGVAWIGVVCNTDFSQGGHWGGGYGITQIYGDYPSNVWDLIGTAHEIGHNFGSPHTHCYSPPIDMCYSGETGCYSGTTSLPAGGKGTLMSYCHFLGGLGAIDLRFDARCINERMLPEILSSACLTDVVLSGATSFYTLAPCRLLDTRNPTGPSGGPSLLANSGRTIPGAGMCGIPSSAVAVAAVVVSILPGSQGDVRLYAAGTALPSTSAINFNSGRVRANNVNIALGAGGQISLFCDMGISQSTTNAVIDVYGYFQ